MLRRVYLKTVLCALLISSFLFLPQMVSFSHADVEGYGTGLKKVLNENYDQAYSLFFEVCIEEKFEIKVILRDDEGEQLTIRFITGDKSHTYSASDDLIKYYIDLKIDDPETGYYNDYILNSTNALDSLEDIVSQETSDRSFTPGDPDAKIKSLTLLGDLYFLREVGFGNTGNNDILWEDDFSEYDNSGYNIGYLDLIEEWDNLTHPVSGFSIGDDDEGPILVAVAPPSRTSSLGYGYGYYAAGYGYPLMGYGYPGYGFGAPFSNNPPFGGYDPYGRQAYYNYPNQSSGWNPQYNSYNYAWNQPYGYGGWNQPAYGWNQPAYGWNQPYFGGYQQQSFNPYGYQQSYNPYGGYLSSPPINWTSVIWEDEFSGYDPTTGHYFII